MRVGIRGAQPSGAVATIFAVQDGQLFTVDPDEKIEVGPRRLDPAFRGRRER